MHDFAHPETLVSTEWAAAHLEDPEVTFVEVDLEPSAYLSGHLPGAVAWNWSTQLCDQTVREILPKSELEALLSQSGIGPGTTIVFYGDHRNACATWAFWQARMHGHRDLRLLNGGRERWLAEGRPMTKRKPKPQLKVYRAKAPDLSLRAYLSDVRKASENGFSVLLDVRDPEEFVGEAAVALTGGCQRSGHIPGAKSVPWHLACESDGGFRSYQELKELYGGSGVDGHLPIITYCSVGERSSLSWFVLKYLLGYASVRNYDGGWTEWGNLVGAPVARGASAAPAGVV